MLMFSRKVAVDYNNPILHRIDLLGITSEHDTDCYDDAHSRGPRVDGDDGDTAITAGKPR